MKIYTVFSHTFQSVSTIYFDLKLQILVVIIFALKAKVILTNFKYPLPYSFPGNRIMIQL